MNRFDKTEEKLVVEQESVGKLRVKEERF